MDGLSSPERRFGAPDFAVCNRKSLPPSLRQGLYRLACSRPGAWPDLSTPWTKSDRSAQPGRSPGSRLIACPAPSHPSADSGLSGRLTGYSGASAADFHRFPCSRPLTGRAGLVGLECWADANNGLTACQPPLLGRQDDCKVAVAGACHSERSEESLVREKNSSLR